MDDAQKKLLAEASNFMMLAADRLTGAITTHTAPKDDEQPANPVYDPAVIQTADKLFTGLYTRGTLSTLQRLFDAGREAGADQEAKAWLDSSMQRMTGNGIKSREHDKDGLRTYGMQDCAKSTLGQTRVAEERYPRPNDPPVAELYREPIVQCPECLTAIYPGESHSCRGYTR